MDFLLKPLYLAPTRLFSLFGTCFVFRGGIPPPPQQLYLAPVPSDSTSQCAIKKVIKHLPQNISHMQQSNPFEERTSWSKIWQNSRCLRKKLKNTIPENIEKASCHMKLEVSAEWMSVSAGMEPFWGHPSWLWVNSEFTRMIVTIPYLSQ